MPVTPPPLRPGGTADTIFDYTTTQSTGYIPFGSTATITLPAAFNDANTCTGDCVYTATSGLIYASDDSPTTSGRIVSMTLLSDGRVSFVVTTDDAIGDGNRAFDVYFTYKTATSKADAKIQFLAAAS